MAFVAGTAFGILQPKLAILMEPLGTNFVRLIKIFIGPIVFLTIVTGIAQTGSLKKLGRIGLKAFVYFEIVSSLALVIGWIAASWIRPGTLIHANVSALNAEPVKQFLQGAEKLSVADFFQNIIPSSIVEPFSKGDMLQVLFLAVLFGIAFIGLGENRTKKTLEVMETLTQSLFQIIRLIMYLAPIGIFGAMAFTIGKFGGHFLIPLIGLIGTFYITVALFLFAVLGVIARWSGFSILAFLRYMSAELFLVLGTASSESALPQLLKKLERLGCEKETVGVVVPMGYSFNLDGTNIYITLAALFIAQALGIHLSLGQELVLFATAMLTSKGAAGVTGAGFITLAATLAVVPSVPPVGIVLVLGIDRFMSEARAFTNFIGNGVAAIVISRWENEVSPKTLNLRMMDHSLDEIVEKGLYEN